jgi:hypothetical protein
MKTDSPLPFSQNIETYPVPEPAKSRTRHPSFSVRFILIFNPAIYT